jgi:hypothetical protein
MSGCDSLDSLPSCSWRYLPAAVRSFMRTFTLLSQNTGHSGQSGLGVSWPLLRVLKLWTELESGASFGLGKFLPVYDRTPVALLGHSETRALSQFFHTSPFGVAVSVSSSTKTSKWTAWFEKGSKAVIPWGVGLPSGVTGKSCVIFFPTGALSRASHHPSFVHYRIRM